MSKSRISMPIWVKVFETPSRYKVIHGGRGSSKSWGAADALVIRAVSGKELILCAREIQLSIKDSSKRVIENAIERHGLSDLFEITRDSIKCPKTGSEFLFFGLKDGGDKLKSFEGITIVWVEEANTVSQQSVDTLHPTIRRDNSEIWYTFNPRLKDDPVYAMFIENEPPPGAIVLKVNYNDNPWFPDVLRDQMEWDRETDPDKYRHVWLGEPVQHTEAQVLAGRWKIAPIPKPPKDVVFYHGADWGFANDPTTLIRCWIDGRTLYVDRAVGAVGVEIDHTPALFKQVDTAEEWEIIGDCARPETISYMNRNGFNIKGSKKGAGSIEDGVEFLRQFEIVIAPELKEVQDECALYSYKTDKRTGMILPVIEDKNNHYIDALRYALERLMKSKEEAFLFAV